MASSASSPIPQAPPRRTFILVGVLLLVFVGSVIFTYNTFTRPFPGFNDFMTPWEAARSFFYEGLDPYSAETSLNIQERLYGRAALPDEQPNHFAYPFYAVFVVYPLIHLDYAWATAIWMVLSEACLIGAALLLLNMYRWKPRPLTIAALLLFTLFAYPATRGLVLGQVSHVVYFLQVYTLWALLRKHDRPAGLALALATFKPQMSVFLVPLLLLWALKYRRWGFIGMFGGGMAGLLGLSFLLQPDWVEGFLYQLTLYPTYIEVSTPAWVITQYYLGLGSSAELALNAVVFGVMLWAWNTGLRHEGRFFWAVILTLTTTHLIGLRTASPHFILFLIPLVFYLRELAKRRRGLVIMGVLAALLVLPWIHFLVTLGDGKFESPSVFLPLPILTYISLWVTRRLWWQSAPTFVQEANHDAA